MVLRKAFQLVRINPSGGGAVLALRTSRLTSFQLVRINPSGGVSVNDVLTGDDANFPISPH